MPRSSASLARSSMTLTLFLAGSTLLPRGESRSSDDDDEKGYTKGYKFDKQDSDDGSWRDNKYDDGDDDYSTTHKTKWWTASETASESPWSATVSPSATTTKWHKSTSTWSSSTSTALSSTTSPSPNNLLTTLLPAQASDSASPQARQVNPVAIAVPLAICGLIGFIALLFCAKKRSAKTRSAPQPSDIEKELQSLILRQQTITSGQSRASDGVTITKRDGGQVSDNDSRHPPSVRRSESYFAEEDRRRAMDMEYTHARSYRSDSRHDSHHQEPFSRSETPSYRSYPSSHSDTCVTPTDSRSMHDRFTRLPSRSRFSQLYSDVQRPDRHDIDYYAPTRKSAPNPGGFPMIECECSSCRQGYLHRPRDHFLNRQPSLLSKRTNTDNGSLANPYSKTEDHYDIFESYYRPKSLRLSRPFASHSTQGYRSEMERLIAKQSQYRLSEPLTRDHSLGSSMDSRYARSQGHSADGLYESLRVALEAPHRR